MIYLVILELKDLYGAVTPKRLKMVLSVIYKLYWHFVRDSKSWRTFKSLYWFRSYGDFTEWVDFDYWWSCIGKGIPCSLCSRLVSNWESLVFETTKGLWTYIVWCKFTLCCDTLLVKWCKIRESFHKRCVYQGRRVS